MLVIMSALQRRAESTRSYKRRAGFCVDHDAVFSSMYPLILPERLVRRIKPGRWVSAIKWARHPRGSHNDNDAEMRTFKVIECVQYGEKGS